MTNSQDMTFHVNAEQRCEQREPEPEGITPVKMEMIMNHRGASWEYIFDKLFPGAPMPSPCKYCGETHHGLRSI